MITNGEAPVAPSLAPDVLEFFRSRRGVFGAMNLLPDHLPGDERVAEIVRNVMTVDYAISRAFEVPLYDDYLGRFAVEAERSCGTRSPGDGTRDTYRSHLAALRAADGSVIAAAVRAAAGDTMETFNLFLPRQCNLSCRGCYAGAVPVAAQPYRDDVVRDFYAGAQRVILAARRCGARTVYTSGDGEPTLFPRFFDLLELLRRQGMQWLFFTAGLAFSSEPAAVETWQLARRWLEGPSRERIAARLAANRADGLPDPTVRALTAELAEYRESVQIYFSVWSANAATNTMLRRPSHGYRYETVDSRGTSLALPSGLTTMMRDVFVGDLRGRLGIEMPVSDASVDEVPAVAAFVVDHGLRSYFEPTIFTGRNRLGGDLGEAPPAALAAVAPLLVRTRCGFRNVHQPTVKFHRHGSRRVFLASPGMGVDANDLRSMGVLDSLVIDDRPDGFFAAVHSPLMVYANYVHITGCKCNDFAAELVRDRAAISARWRAITEALPTAAVGLDAIEDRLVPARAAR